MHFQAQNLRCRFGVLPEITDVKAEDSVFRMLFWEFPSAWRMIWGQSEIRPMVGFTTPLGPPN